MKAMLPLLVVVALAGCSAQHATGPQTSTSAPVASPIPVSASRSVPTPVASGSPTPAATSVPTPVASQSPIPAATSPQAPTPDAPTSSVEASGTATLPAPGPCTDDDLTVGNGTVQSANTQRRVLVSFTNSSSHACMLTGYPGADLVTAAGGVLVHVQRRTANAAHHLTLNPGDAANADVLSYVIDTTTGDDCGRIGTLVVTPPNGYVSHTLTANLPICSATISSVS